MLGVLALLLTAGLGAVSVRDKGFWEDSGDNEEGVAGGVPILCLPHFPLNFYPLEPIYEKPT